MRPRALLLIAAMVSVSMSAGGGAPVLCLHHDGTAALESGADRCCEGGRREAATSGGVALEQAPSGCPGCEDRLITRDLRRDPAGPDLAANPLAVAAQSRPDARASSLRFAHARAGEASRGAPRPLPLRI